MDARQSFLIEMYKATWNNINRHILVVWQPVAVLLSAVAALALSEKAVLPLDYAATLVMIVAIWQAAHVLDAGLWYNRNQLILTNVERQFLVDSDLREIHYYFGERREPKLLDHFKIQLGLGMASMILVLLRHFRDRVYPGLRAPTANFDPERAMPYAILVFGVAILLWRYGQGRKKHRELMGKSPGAAVRIPEAS
jgi:hypothetical protein